MYLKSFVSTCVAMALMVSATALGSEQAAIDAQAAFGLKEVKRILSNDSPQEFGLKDRSELALLKLGAPIPAYRLDPMALETYFPGQRLSTILTPMEELYYPVMVKGTTRFVLWVAKLEGRWEFAGFGQTELGKSLTGLLAKHNPRTAAMKIVLQPQTQAKMALVEQAGKERLYYISSYPWSFNSLIRNDLTELSQPEMMLQLKEATRRMIHPPPGE